MEISKIKSFIKRIKIKKEGKNERRKEKNKEDILFYFFLKISSFSIIILFLGLVLLLLNLSYEAFAHFGFDFFISNIWDPANNEYGALAMIYGTMVSSFLALSIAAPVSIGTALFLSELAPKWFSVLAGFLVEMLAAIPSIVYGLWGVFVLAPVMRNYLEPFLADYLGYLPLFSGPPIGVGMLTAGIILAIMITPTITSISREVFRTVPEIIKEGSLALGFTRWEMIKISILKSTKSGIFAAIILGLGRAVGETMAVTMVIGNRNDISFSLLAPGQTMASIIANEYTEANDSLHLSALAAIGFTLLLVSICINILARFIIWRMETNK